MKREELVGRKFGRLTVMEFSGKNKFRNLKWICVCDCGCEKEVFGYRLKSGETQSCGCLHKERQRERVKHGYSRRGAVTTTYKTWRSIKDRCFNPTQDNYKYYGGRGITVCERWLDKEHGFENFLADMGEQPDGLTLDRENSSGDYTPENCRWITQQEQCNNQRANHRVTYKGKTRTIAEWARFLGIHYCTLWARINSYDWSLERAFNTQ